MRMIALVVVVALSGCANWKHPTATQQDFNRDSYQCQMETASVYQPNQTAMSSGYRGPAQTNCSTYGNQTNCTTTPGVYVPPVTQDTNALPRAMAFNSCMQARGYYK